MRIKKQTNLIWFGLFLIGIVMILFDRKGDMNAILIFACLLFVFELTYALRKMQSRVFFFCFLVAFFTFLLSGEILDRYVGVFEASFTYEIDRHTDLCLVLSLIGLFMGYVVSEYYGRKFRIVTSLTRKNRRIDYDGGYCKSIRKISKYLFLATYSIWMLVLWRQVSYVLKYGYMTYYLKYSSGLPQIAHDIADICPVAFYLFLATMPSKKELRIPLVFYLIRCVLSLGTGRRLHFIVGLLIVFAYLVARNKYNAKGEVWFSKRMIIALVISVPFLLVGLYLFEYIRADSYVGNADDFNPLLGFFARQGISVNVIKYAERYKAGLNENTFYSLYNTAKFLQTNIINKYLFKLDFGYYSAGQTVQNALNSNSLANYISYHVSSNSYLNGVGMGSCYIAELYVDFGYAGVVIGNFIFGVVLQSLYERAMNRQGIWSFTVGLYVADLLLRANRSTFDAFFAEPLSFTFWGTLLIIHFIAEYCSQQRAARVSVASDLEGRKVSK